MLYATLFPQVEAEMKKKSKGKGLSVLSGRALFDYDATLFAVSILSLLPAVLNLHLNESVYRVPGIRFFAFFVSVFFHPIL